jgi:hypothetical protein
LTEEVKDYHILVYGSKLGYKNRRAQISLYGSDKNTIAYLRFMDQGTSFGDDYLDENGKIVMQLPSEMFEMKNRCI